MQYIPINKNNIPEQFTINFGGDAYTIRVDYNMTFDYFTISLYKVLENELQPIILGEKLVLGKYVWSDFIPDILVGPQLIPLDLSGKEQRINYENFGESVFLYVDDQEFIPNEDEGEFNANIEF